MYSLASAPKVNVYLYVCITLELLTFQMSTSSKIIKAGGVEPTPFETSISQALVELENNSELKTHLRELYITRVKEIDFGNKKVYKSTI